MIPAAFTAPAVRAASDGPPQILKTRYTEISYPSTDLLSDFFWRISGRRFTFTGDTELATARVDRIAERVQAILDMQPPGFRVGVDLYPQYQGGHIAAYSAKTGAIKVYVDKITDGVFAHEMAHAVISSYFDAPPPHKVQEILAQYVDQHLWEDY